MLRLAGTLLALALLAPLAAAAGVEAPPGAAFADDAGLRLAAAASAAQESAAAGASAAASAFAALGEGIAGLAATAGRALAAGGAALAAMGVGLLDILASAARALGAAASALASAATAALATLGVGARWTFEVVRAHPREAAMAAGGATGLGLLAWAAKRLAPLLAGVPLYTRLRPSEMLDNKARASVYEHVRANPGAHPSAIAETLGLGWGTVVYHLARLEESKLVTPRSAHNRKCYFAVGSDLDAQGRTAVAAMAHEKARSIVQVVRAQPGISQKALAERVGMSQALASWHVKKLVESGVLLTERAGRSNALRVAGHVPDATPPSLVVAA